MRLVDTHAHLMDPQLAPLVDEVLERARASGVLAAIAIGTDVDSSRRRCLGPAAPDGVCVNRNSPQRMPFGHL
jgi:Tat protein secretion system quality control protein TatD with DNase activity